jgi:hypothetical protein
VSVGIAEVERPSLGGRREDGRGRAGRERQAIAPGRAHGVQQIVIASCGKMKPIGPPPTGVQLPPVGLVEKVAPCIVKAGVTHVDGSGVTGWPTPASQSFVGHKVTRALVVQSTPVGVPQLHGAQPRVSCAVAL